MSYLHPYRNEGHCNVCNNILDPDTFICIGANDYCSQECFKSFRGYYCKKEDNHAVRIPELREEMRETVSRVLNISSPNESISEEYIVEECSVPIIPAGDSVDNYEFADYPVEDVISRYVSNRNEILTLQEENINITNNLKEVQKLEPTYIEYLGQWKTYKETLEDAEGMTTGTLESNKKRIDKLDKEQLILLYMIQESDDIPKDKWVRCGDVGIIFHKKTQAVQIKKWNVVLQELEPKKENVRWKNIKSAVGNIANITFALLFLGFIVSIAPVIWYFITGSILSGLFCGIITNIVFYYAGKS